MHTLGKFVIGTAFAFLLPQVAFSAPPTQVFGWSEEGVIMPEKTSVKIELDTSVETSSLAAGNIVPFDKNGEKWVRFTVQVPQGPQALMGVMVDVPFERPVLRTEKAKGAVSGHSHRQVVKMTLCIGKQMYDEELALKSQSKKGFPIVLGRNILQHLGTVDAGRMNTVKPECTAAANKQAS